MRASSWYLASPHPASLSESIRVGPSVISFSPSVRWHAPLNAPTFPILRSSSTRVHAKAEAEDTTFQEASGSDLKAGVAVYKPKSYEVLVTDAANSLSYALEDGKIRLEIDFPPLPSSYSSYKGSSDEFIDANIQLALAVVKKLNEVKRIKTCIVFPDGPEKRRASKLFKTAFETVNGLRIGCLDDVRAGPVSTFFKSVRNTLDFDFDDKEQGRHRHGWLTITPLFLFIILPNFSVIVYC